jgi:hypothetical protein
MGFGVGFAAAAVASLKLFSKRRLSAQPAANVTVAVTAARAAVSASERAKPLPPLFAMRELFFDADLNHAMLVLLPADLRLS